jgi:hypothetical protein
VTLAAHIRALTVRRRRPALLPPQGHTPAQAAALRVPAECPPALLAVLADIARRVATEAGQGGEIETK